MRCYQGPYQNGLYSLWKPAGYCAENGPYPPWKPAGYCNEDFGTTGEIDDFACPPHLKTVKECVKKYKACYKLYKISTFCLYKTCSLCGREFDYYRHRGCCPFCC